MKKASIKKGHKAINNEHGMSRIDRVARSIADVSRRVTFIRSITSKYDRPLVTNPSAFLDNVGRKFAGSELPGFRGSLIHKGSGHSLHQSFYTWFIEAALSLTVNRLEQCFGIWLNQTRTQRTLSNLENGIHLVLQRPAQQASLSRLAQVASAPPGSYELLRTVTQAVPAALLKAPDVLHAIERSLRVIYANRSDAPGRQSFYLPSFQTIQPLLAAYAAVRAGEIKREFGVNLPASRSRVFVSPQPRDRLWEEYEPARDSYRAGSLELKAAAFSAREMARKIEAMYLTNPLAGSAAAPRMTYVSEGDEGGYYRFPKAEFVSRSPGTGPDAETQTADHLKSVSGRSDQALRHRRAGREAVSHWPAALTKIGKWIEQKERTYLSFAGVKASSARTANSVLLERGRSRGSRAITENILAPLLNRKLAAGTLKAYVDAEGRQNLVVNELSFMRREDQMRPPMRGYAFAQPARSTIVEEEIVKLEQEKEVTRIVRREMETLMKSRSPMTELSRFDYSRITDRVWFSLSRRLMMEKERLGAR